MQSDLPSVFVIYSKLFLCVQEQIGVLLKKTGLGMLLSSLSKVLTFLAAALIPIPALRIFSLQSAILSLFHLGTMLLVFPAVLSLDLKRRRAGRADLLCCCLPAPDMQRKPTSEKFQTITRALPPDRQQTVTSVVAPNSALPTVSVSITVLGYILD